VKSWKPDWIVFENVKGIAATEGGAFLCAILSEFHSCGYTTDSWILNAVDYGVPQRRERLFVVGSRHGIRLTRPAPAILQPVSVREAIADLPNLENGASVDWLSYDRFPKSPFALSMRGKLKSCSNHLVTKNAKRILRRYGHVRPGGNWEHIPARLMRNYANRMRCHSGIYHRLREDAPSIVIGNFRKNMLIHPWQDRGLSVREAARLQSFPDSHCFLGSIGFQQQQVGNAVPPLLSKAVFEAVVKGSRVSTSRLERDTCHG
jgi:DNA (cytosine-5)-methyltransferase 1